MAEIMQVQLVSTESHDYRRHMAANAFMARSNSAETTPDMRFPVTTYIEGKVRELLSDRFSQLDKRVIKWIERQGSLPVVTRYKELDGAFHHNKTGIIILEVKATASKSSIKSGIKQLRASRGVLAKRYQNVFALLAICNAGAFMPEFKPRADSFIESDLGRMDVEIVEWPHLAKNLSSIVTTITFLPDEMIKTWLNGYCC